MFVIKITRFISRLLGSPPIPFLFRAAIIDSAPRNPGQAVLAALLFSTSLELTLAKLRKAVKLSFAVWRGGR